MEVIVVADVEMEQSALQVRRRIAIVAGGEKPYFLGSIPSVFEREHFQSSFIYLYVFLIFLLLLLFFIMKYVKRGLIKS